jgi:hypothetical protein
MAAPAFLGASPLLAAQQGPPREERIEKLTAAAKPAIAMSHLGFLPDAPKTVIYRVSREDVPSEFLLRDIGSPPEPYQVARALVRTKSDFGDVMLGSFADINRSGMYNVTAAGERSVPFFIRRDL